VKEPNPWQLKTKIDFLLCFQQFSVELCDNRCNSSPANMLFHSQAALTLTYNNSCMKPPKSSKELQRAPKSKENLYRSAPAFQTKKTLFSHCLLLSCTFHTGLDQVWQLKHQMHIVCVVGRICINYNVQMSFARGYKG